MNSRERVLKAIKRMDGNPDRVPIQFDLCKQHIEYFSKKYGIPVDITPNLYEDVTWRISANELRTRMGSDLVLCGASTPADWKPEIGPDGTWYNEYHMKMRQGPVYVDVVGFPLAGIEEVEQVEAYQFPDPHEPTRYAKAEEIIAKYKKDFVVVGNIEVTMFQLAQQLLGMEQMLCDLQMEEPYIDRLYERCIDFQTEVGLELIRRGVDMIWASDDFGTQTSLLINEHLFRDHIKPLYKKMFDTFKKANPDIIIAFHCDGAVKPILNDFVEMGIEIFNPVQPGVPGHGPQELKDFIGDKLCFWGAIDQQRLLPHGSDEELAKEVEARMKILGKDRGYIIAPAHIIQADVAPERVEYFLKLCKQYGAIYG
jgi:uroporphyrinogen decarboxylase